MPLPFRPVANQIQPLAEPGDPTAMYEGLGQALVTVMTHDEQTGILTGRPALDARLREMLPGKGRARFSLTAAVGFERVVGAGRSKLLPFGQLNEITTGAGITEDVTPVDDQLETQGVRVAVTGSAESLRSGVGKKLLRQLLIRSNAD
jgi:hypothetical protein